MDPSIDPGKVQYSSVKVIKYLLKHVVRKTFIASFFDVKKPVPENEMKVNFFLKFQHIYLRIVLFMYFGKYNCNLSKNKFKI